MKAVARRLPSPRLNRAEEGNDLSQGARRQLKAILSADVQGYSRLMSEDEMQTIHTLHAYRDLIASHVRDYRGRVVDSPGDNLLAEFGSIVHAVECAVEIQKHLESKNSRLPGSSKMEYRIGVNLGDVVIDKDRLYGDGVNIAARIEKLAEPGGIAISGTVFDQIENKLRLNYECLGEKTLKNILKPVRVYRIKLSPGTDRV
jgi:class 3 adenylate cyclase